MLSHLKWLLTLIGAEFSHYALLQLQAFVNYLRIGRWMRNHVYSSLFGCLVEKRFGLQ